MRMCRGTPEKCEVLLYTLHVSSIELYIMQNHHYGNTTCRYGDPSACACSVYQAPSPPRLEGLGTRLDLVLQCNLDYPDPFVHRPIATIPDK